MATDFLATDLAAFMAQTARPLAAAMAGLDAANKGGPGSGFFGHSGRPGQVGGSARGPGRSSHAGAISILPTSKSHVAGIYESGTVKKTLSLTVNANPIAYHGTFADSAAAIAEEGFRASLDGTAGPGVYMTYDPKDALYEKNPDLSAAVSRHGGRQADVVLKTQITGRMLDVGRMEDRYGPSMYWRPHMYAAAVLETAAGRALDTAELFKQPRRASEIIQAHGYAGVSWRFADGRQAAVVLDITP